MDLVIAAVSIAVLGSLIVAGILYGRQLHRQLLVVRAELCEHFGLRDKAPGGIFPNLAGDVDGLSVSVDVVQLSYTTGDDSGSHKRPWTRVRVEAPVDADLTVHARDQRYDKTPIWLPRTTGDAAFDAKYIVYAPPTLDLQEALPAPARAAFVRADPSATLSGGYVWWMRVKHVRDPELMVAVVEACLAVARATRR